MGGGATNFMFLVLAVAVVSGKDHECPVLYQLVDQLVETLGKGVLKAVDNVNGAADKLRKLVDTYADSEFRDNALCLLGSIAQRW